MSPELHRPRSRSRSPARHASERRRRSRSPARPPAPKARPFGTRELSRHDLHSFRPLFALYLDVQKRLDIDDLDETEVKGRWKSFMGKWNRGELAEGWYDRQTLDRAKANASSNPPDVTTAGGSDEDDYGPALPSVASPSRHRDHALDHHAPGASIPSLQDLQARDEQNQEDASQARRHYRADIRHERAGDRKVQKERMDEMAPRADPGTRERQLEKKRDLADSNRAFAASKDGGDVDLREADVMGDEDSLGDLKRRQREQDRRKNEREIRREEILRARKAETEARLAGMREKEERTMAMFQEIAKARFGGRPSG